MKRSTLPAFSPTYPSPPLCGQRFKLRGDSGILTYSLIHSVVLDVPMEGDLVADVNVNGVPLHALLFLFLLVRTEVEVSGPAPLPRRIGVRWRLNIDGPGQLPVYPTLF